jgi:dTDP-4-amino-4,6-dideoxygalactose transaminase
VSSSVKGAIPTVIPIAQAKPDRRELLAVERVLGSGQLRAGRVVDDFEERFAQAVGARFAVAGSSGTAALYLAYQALLGPDDEIIVQDFTFVATASMALAVGARPVLADVDPETFTLDPADVERRITRRTRALAPVHLYGRPAEIGTLLRIARRYKLTVIWDAALRARRRNAALLTRLLEGTPGILLPRAAAGVLHAFNLYTLRLDPTSRRTSRDEFSKALARPGIETAVHYPTPLHRQPIFRGCGNDRDFPESTRLARTVLSLPVHPGLTQKDVVRIARAVREVAEAAAQF